MKEAPKPEALFPWGTAKRKLYEALLTEGEVSNVRIQRGLRVHFYADALDDIRAAIRPYGLDVIRQKLRGGLSTYRIAVTQQQAA